MSSPRHPVVILLIVALAGTMTACQSDPARSTGTTTAPEPGAPVLQPGRPGEPNLSIAGAATVPVTPAVDPDDTRFIQEMISHHAQALRMVTVASSQLTDPKAKSIAGRIKAAQGPEIQAMASWLKAHGQEVPLEATYPLAAPGGNHHGMPGMASRQQLEALARARGVEADRVFLTLMIAHHEGALVMALDQRKNGTDDRTTELSDDVSVTQSAEIRHMQQMLSRLGSAS